MGALLLVDLDQFKYVNDALGHVVGDDLLKLVAQRLAANVRPQDIVARFGGDEFSVLLTDVGRKEAAAACAELVKRVQEEPFVVGGRSLSLRCSVGATMIRGTRAPATLLSQADMACHQAKASNRNQFQFYKTSSSEVAEMNADAAWLQDIQAALKTDAFVLHYQPIVEIGSRRTAYYEVLLRKRGGGRELVAPGAFIPAATRLGLMTELDQWVVRHALRTLGEVRGSRSDVRFTLNVSGSTFERPDFFDYLENELRCSGVPPNAIVIEITEQIAVRNLGATARQMAALVDRGCGFAIDDFGSGYCSYNYLKELPVAFVKIDGSFVVNLAGDPVDQKIVGAISEVATATGCKTIAEHVENHRTLRLLERLGDTYPQGYFLGKPSARVGDERFAAATLRPPRRRAN
jgi:diguanylate cyclase (GGDEF)-like protein